MTVKYYYASFEVESGTVEMLVVDSDGEEEMFERSNGADWFKRSFQAVLGAFGIPAGTSILTMPTLGFNEIQEDDLATYNFNPADFVGVKAAELTAEELAQIEEEKKKVTAAAAAIVASQATASSSSSYLIPAAVAAGVLILALN